MMINSNERKQFLNKSLKNLQNLCYRQLNVTASVLSINNFGINTHKIRNCRRLKHLAKNLPSTIEEYLQICSQNENNRHLENWDEDLFQIIQKFRLVIKRYQKYYITSHFCLYNQTFSY